MQLRADEAPSPAESRTWSEITDTDVKTMLKDHLSVNSTVVVTWDEKNKPVVRGSKTEGAGVLLVESMGFRYITIRGMGAKEEPTNGAAAGVGGAPAGATGESADSAAAALTVKELGSPHSTSAGTGAGTSGPGSGVPRMGTSKREIEGGQFAEGAVHIVRQYPFTAERKMMSTLVALDPSNPVHGPVRLYVTGACVGVVDSNRHIALIVLACAAALMFTCLLLSVERAVSRCLGVRPSSRQYDAVARGHCRP